MSGARLLLFDLVGVFVVAALVVLAAGAVRRVLPELARLVLGVLGILLSLAFGLTALVVRHLAFLFLQLAFDLVLAHVTPPRRRGLRPTSPAAGTLRSAPRAPSRAPRPCRRRARLRRLAHDALAHGHPAAW